MTLEEFHFLEDLYVHGFSYEELTEKYVPCRSLKKRRYRLIKIAEEPL